MDEAQLLQALSALAHPIRLGIYRRLAAEPAGLGPNAIAAQIDLPRNLVSYHLQPMVVAGLIRSERRGRDMNYGVLPDALVRLATTLVKLTPEEG